MLNPRYNHLEIEWKHSAVGDATCERCGNTGEALRTAREELRREFAPAGVKINLTETILGKTRIAESNEIHMTGVLFEDILAAGIVSTPTAPPVASVLASLPAEGPSRSGMNTTKRYRPG